MKRFPIKKDRTMRHIVERELREALEETRYIPERTLPKAMSRPFGSLLGDLWPKQ